VNTLQEALHEVLEQQIAELLASGKISEADLDDISEHIESAVTDLIAPVSDEVLRTLKDTAPNMLKKRRALDRRFRSRNFDRWRKGLELLETFYVICEESGSDYNNEFRPKAVETNDFLFEAVANLHARALLVTGEILCLIKGGYPDGALGRWRTLHEIAVIAQFLAAHDNETAERYLSGRNVQAYRAMCQYQQYAEAANLQPYSQDELDAARLAQEATVERYGKSIKSEYGWAAGVLKKDNPTFRDIEEIVRLDHWRPRYKWASDYTHANFKPSHTLLGMCEAREPMLLVGQSNSGMTDPAHMTTLSLVQATAALLLLQPNFDRLVIMKVLLQLSDEIGDTFLQIDQKTSISTENQAGFERHSMSNFRYHWARLKRSRLITGCLNIARAFWRRN
jgi:hypothetical protein